ncbi:MAG: DUF3365 domain-containing protein [Flavobacteriales bacterium]|nr:DUF3365 domain-containing protein [Flavobacteriales bacterium]
MRHLLSIAIVSVSGLVAWNGCSNAPEQSRRANVQYLKGTDGVTYLKIGKEVADSVGGVLKRNLMKAMEEGGAVHAVEFCNAQAMPLTASFSKKYNTEVKRTSDRLRNPGNAPDDMEVQVIADYRKDHSEGKKLSAKVAIDAQGRKVFYAPIITSGQCMVCHGAEGDMTEDLRGRINALYPTDNAKGFNIDELRGIWSITFKTI